MKRWIWLALMTAGCPGSDCRTYSPEQACVAGRVKNVWCGDVGYVAGGTPSYRACGTLDGGVQLCVASGDSCLPDGGQPD